MSSRPIKKRLTSELPEEDARITEIVRAQALTPARSPSLRSGLSRRATPAPDLVPFSPIPHAGEIPQVLRNSGETFGSLGRGFQFTGNPLTIPVKKEEDDDSSLYGLHGSDQDDQERAHMAVPGRTIQSFIPEPTSIIPTTDNEFRTWINAQMDAYIGPQLQVLKTENAELKASNERMKQELVDLRATANKVASDLTLNLDTIKEALNKAGVPTSMQYDGSLLDRVTAIEYTTTELEQRCNRLSEEKQTLQVQVQSLTTDLAQSREAQTKIQSTQAGWNEWIEKEKTSIAAFATQVKDLQQQIYDVEKEAIEADDNTMNVIMKEAGIRANNVKTLLDSLDRMADVTEVRFQKLEQSANTPAFNPPAPTSKRAQPPDLPGGGPPAPRPDGHGDPPNGSSSQNQPRGRSRSRDRGPKPSAPEHWDGTTAKLDNFVRQLRFYMNHEFWGRITETNKINTALTFFRTTRTSGFADEIARRVLQHRDFDDFLDDLVRKFGDHHLQARRIGEFQNLTQERRSVAEYNRKFNELCLQTSYDRTTDFALTKYKVGLNQKWFDAIEHERPEPVTLDDWQYLGEKLELKAEQNAKLRMTANNRFSTTYQRPSISAIQFEKKPDGCIKCGEKHERMDTTACKWDAKKKCNFCGMKNHLEKACLRKLNGHPRPTQVLSIEADTQPNQSTDSPKA